MSKHFSLKTLLQNFDLLTYIEQTQDYKSTGTSEYRIKCPNCQNENYKCYVNIDKRLFNCFTCDFSSKDYDFFDLVAKVENLSRQQAITKCALSFKRTVPEHLEFAHEEEEKSYVFVNDIKTIQFPSGIPFCTDGVGYSYLLDRGLTPDEIKDCQVRFTGDPYWIKNENGKVKGNLQNRVIIPIYGPPGLVSYQGRHINPPERCPKYLSAPDTDLSKTLWPFVPPFAETAIIVEGTLDALAVRRLPKTSAYATFGKKLSPYQINILQEWGVKELIIFFDKKDALPQIKSIAEKCKTKFKDVLIPDYSLWPNGIDAGDCLKLGIDPIKKALDNRVSVYSIEYLKMILEGNM